VTASQRRFDLALAAVSALLLGGMVFNAFGLASWLFSANRRTMWSFWFLGTGLWVLAMGIFFSFLNHPLPRHAHRSYTD